MAEPSAANPQPAKRKPAPTGPSLRSDGGRQPAPPRSTSDMLRLLRAQEAERRSQKPQAPRKPKTVRPVAAKPVQALPPAPKPVSVGVPALPRPAPATDRQPGKPITPIPIKPPIGSRPGVSPELGRAVEFAGAQQAERLAPQEGLRDTQQEMMATAGGSGMGVIETRPKSYAVEGAEALEPEGEIGERARMQARSSQMQKTQEQFLGPGAVGAGAEAGPGETAPPSRARPSAAGAGEAVEEELPLELQRRTALETARLAEAPEEEEAEAPPAPSPAQQNLARMNRMWQFVNGIDAITGFEDIVGLAFALIGINIALVNGLIFKNSALPQAQVPIEACLYCSIDCVILFFVMLAMSQFFVLVGVLAAVIQQCSGWHANTISAACHTARGIYGAYKTIVH